MNEIDEMITQTKRFCEAVMQSQTVRGRSELLFFSESNYGGSAAAAHAYNAIVEWAAGTPYRVRGILAHDSKQTMPGYWSSPRKKVNMALQTKLLLDNGRLRLSKEFVAPRSGPAGALGKLVRQMGNFENRFKPEKMDAVRDEAVMPSVYSGKTTSESDDVIVILQEAILISIYYAKGDLNVTTPNATYRPPVLKPRFNREVDQFEDIDFSKRDWESRALSKWSHLLSEKHSEMPNTKDHAMETEDDDDRLLALRTPYSLDDSLLWR